MQLSYDGRQEIAVAEGGRCVGEALQVHGCIRGGCQSRIAAVDIHEGTRIASDDACPAQDDEMRGSGGQRPAARRTQTVSYGQPGGQDIGEGRTSQKSDKLSQRVQGAIITPQKSCPCGQLFFIRVIISDLSEVRTSGRDR